MVFEYVVKWAILVIWISKQIESCNRSDSYSSDVGSGDYCRCIIYSTLLDVSKSKYTVIGGNCGDDYYEGGSGKVNSVAQPIANLRLSIRHPAAYTTFIAFVMVSYS